MVQQGPNLWIAAMFVVICNDCARQMYEYLPGARLKQYYYTTYKYISTRNTPGLSAAWRLLWIEEQHRTSCCRRVSVRDCVRGTRPAAALQARTEGLRDTFIVGINKEAQVDTEIGLKLEHVL